MFKPLHEPKTCTLFYMCLPRILATATHSLAASQLLFLLLGRTSRSLGCRRLTRRRRNFDRLSLALFRREHESHDRDDQLGEERDHARTRQLPGGDANAANWGLGEREDPFGVVREPAVRQPEHGLLGEPKGEAVLRDFGEGPSEAREVGVEL